MVMPDDPSRASSAAACEATTDPVLVQRQRVAGWVRWGQRIGWGLFGLATAAFVVGFTVGLEQWVVTLIVICLVAGSIVLAPAIVFGHGIHAANRADREDSW